MENINQNIFPRRLTDFEKKFLFCLLPEDRSGYLIYRDKIEKMVVIGEGRFGGGNFILGIEHDKPDLDIPSAPIFVCGEIIVKKHPNFISIHEEKDNKIEIDLGNLPSSNEDNSEIEFWTYSTWLPGNNSPRKNCQPREIHIAGGKLVLAVSMEEERIWLYDSRIAVNILIPLTNFFNELMLYKKIKDPQIALNPKRLFTHLNDFSDNDLIQGFLCYNKYLNRVKIDESIFTKEKPVKPKSKFHIFKKREKHDR